MIEQLQLVIGIVGSCVGNVVENLFAREAKAVGDRQEADGPEGTLCVNVQTLALAPAHVEGELAGDSECVADLRLAGTELSKDLGDAAGLNTTGEQSVKVLGASGDGDELAAALMHLGGGSEPHGDKLGRYENSVSGRGWWWR